MTVAALNQEVDWLMVGAVTTGPLALICAVVASRIRTKSKGSGTSLVRKGQTGMHLPEVWNETEISIALNQYRDTTNVMGQYLDALATRFLIGQDIQTIEVRCRFLERFNGYAEVARKTYGWRRALLRAVAEEDLKDILLQAQIQSGRNALEDAHRDPELRPLEQEAARGDVRVRIERNRKEIRDISKPDPPPPPPPPAPPRPPTPEEIRAQERAKLDHREQEILDQIRQTMSDPNLDEEMRERKLNALYEKLAEIHDKQAALL